MSEVANILLVDDRKEKLLALKTALSGLNQNIITAGSGQDALRILLKEKFAVIILDVNMPGMDGFETASLIRQRKTCEHTPIIFVTGINTHETHVSRGYSLGAVDYIFTPVESVVLRAKVSALVDIYIQSKRLRIESEKLRLEAESRARRAQTSLESLLNRLNVGVFKISEAGIVDCNPAFLRHLGLSSLSEIGSVDISSLYLKKRLWSAERIIGSEAGVVPLTRKDGRVIWASVSLSPGESNQGELVIDGLMEDVTRRKEAEDALLNKSEELIRSNADLEQYAMLVSHDLQQPLHLISSYSVLLEKQYATLLGGDALKIINSIRSATSRMSSLIKSFLSFSRPGQRAEMTDIKCDDVLDRVLLSLEESIVDKGVVITRKGQLPEVTGDAVTLGQVFQNIIANAIKYKGPGLLEIVISSRKVGSWWELEFSDNGPGLNSTDQKKIFELFYRGNDETCASGSGIGLALCRKIITHHGGTIRVSSEKGKGASFIITLPARASEPTSPLKPRESVFNIDQSA